MTKTLAVEPDQGEALWFFGCHTTIKAEHDNVGAVVEHWCPGGMTTPLHVQPEDYEAFYVLAGDVTVFADDDSVSLSPGSYIYVPAGTPHAWRVDSEQARVLNLTTTQHADWFRAAGEPAPQRKLPPPGPLDTDKFNAASEKYNVQLLGDPPS